MSNKSLILVIIQFSSFLFFAVAGDLFATSYLLGIQILGLLLGLWGIVAMKYGNFNIQPEVKISANLVSVGPYKIIRNPMYSGLLLFFGISILANFGYIRLVVFVLLAIVLLLKINMEESFLTQRFGEEYVSYKKKTFRLIPFVF